MSLLFFNLLLFQDFCLTSVRSRLIFFIAFSGLQCELFKPQSPYPSYLCGKHTCSGAVVDEQVQVVGPGEQLSARGVASRIRIKVFVFSTGIRENSKQTPSTFRLVLPLYFLVVEIYMEITGCYFTLCCIKGKR